MFNGIPINRYQFSQLKKYATITALCLGGIVIAGNLIVAIISDSISVERSAYVLKNGFPLFNSEKEYISLIKNYPYDAGVKLGIHRMRAGESFWQVAKRNNITIDTFIAANPHIPSLNANRDTEVVIPAEDGVLFAFDDVIDVWRMSRLLDADESLNGDYLPSLFKLISKDDVRLVFFKEATPVVVNDSLDKLYAYGKIFSTPLKGYFTSLFGDRVDPYFHDTAFHTGIDIHGKMGTPIKASKSGMVMFSGWKDGYGNTVILQHHEGYSTVYAHLTDIHVKQGQWVHKQQTIGTTGSTGRSTGPHLHFEIRRHGNPINPLLYIW
ncbi:MAG TPA: M23 family metallopeptidase [Spirochaetota bacterium]|nr:M23 family metallopeptidase [Spirochaetota bacterium]HPI89216.1 M23 family metallopeptidase [Spirochaetota bacterium]HPR48967.1 M23 family metallopeptidase [Spirochaetota bacterium]